MKPMIKPKKLNRGDTVATISLSGGSASEPGMRQWYMLAKERLETVFGLHVIESPNSRKSPKYIYNNPKARADDFMELLQNPSIKAIFLNQGGDDSIRTLDYIDLSTIINNPKIFLGFSDATIIHFLFMKAGITSFSGPNVLTTLSEPCKLHDYTIKWMEKSIFNTAPIGDIEAPSFFVDDRIDWQNGIHTKREEKINKGYELLQGSTIVQGRLMGGSLGPIVYMLKGTSLFPKIDDWENSILFLDTISSDSSFITLVHMLRGLAATGIFNKVNGMIFSSLPQIEQREDIKKAIIKVVQQEEKLDIPILLNIHFGHLAPMNTIPYGVMAEIDSFTKSFRILESGVSE